MVWGFWLAILFLVYTFAGYIFLLRLVCLVRSRPHSKQLIYPTVSLIIPAHNAGRLIGRKIINCFAFDYPPDKLQILVASDGSSDDTVEIVRAFADRGVKLIEIKERLGKHYAQMVARDHASGEIFVFTDTSVVLDPGALKAMLSNFADRSIGCVTSEDHFLVSEGKTAGEGTYIHYDQWMRRLESRVGSLVSLSGSFFAARREVCTRWNPYQSSDFFLALETVSQGLRAVVDPECRGQYNLRYTENVELPRKVRTIVHGLDVFFSYLRLLNPFRFGFFSWQLLSHKLFRWMVPYALVVLLVSSAFLWNSGWFYRAAFLGQLIVYGFGLLGLLFSRLNNTRVFRLPAFFLMGTIAGILAWLMLMKGERFGTWEPTPRH